MARARRSAASAQAGRPRDHGRAERRDDERRTAAAAEVSDSLSRSFDVHDAGKNAAMARRRVPHHRGIPSAVQAAAIRGESLSLRGGRACLTLVLWYWAQGPPG